ncbi:MAG TPA: cell wall-binding repeat-containing protein [Solirubrobacteraceae bacterium]|nr:cell wall-binding repeat-containing protein [Solirubrobacteraceae bacterium]
MRACALAALAATAGACGGKDAPDPPAATTPSAAKSPPVGSQFGRNVARVPGVSAADVAGAAVMAAFPPERGERPGGIVLANKDSWRELVLAAQFAADPVNAAVLPIERDYLPTAAVDLVYRLKPKGFRKAKGLQALILGRAGDDVLIDLQDAQLKMSQLKGMSPAKLSAELVPYRSGFAGRHTSTIVIVSGRDRDRDYALPAAAWSAFSGDTVAFVDGDDVPQATRDLLVQRRKLRLEKPTMYVIGPESVVSDDVVSELEAYGDVKRVAGRDAPETAVAVARYRDRSTGFGWGQVRGPGSISLVNPRNWAEGVGALSFAARGPRAPLLLTDERGELPGSVRGYLRELRGDDANQGFAFGGEKSLATPVLADLDALLGPPGEARDAS